MYFTFEKLVKAVIAGVVFYSDSHNKEALFAEFYNGANVKCFARLESIEFKSYLYMKALEVTNGKQSLNDDAAVIYIRKYFTHYGFPPKTDVYIRTAGDLEKGIEYDLKNDSQQSVRISKKGWRVATKKKYKFIDASTALPQVIPQKSNEGLLKLLKPFVNITGNEYIIFVIWLVQAFCSGHHSALLVRASHGSGKSSLSRVIRQILDPSETDISHMPKDTKSLLCTLSNLYLVCYDNVRSISVEQSDILCQAITGATATGRSLYTNNDLYVQKLHNAVVINGISVSPTESDLAERFLVVNLKKIDKKSRKREKDLWRSFDEKLPEILGAIFETLHKAMKNFETLSIKDMPRMADSFADMLIIALALGVTEDEFRKIYAENVEKMMQIRMGTPIVKAVHELMDRNPGKRAIEDSAASILTMLKEAYSGNPNDLPADASHLTPKIDKEHENLSAAGFRVNIDDTYQMNTRIKILRKKK